MLENLSQQRLPGSPKVHQIHRSADSPGQLAYESPLLFRGKRVAGVHGKVEIAIVPFGPRSDRTENDREFDSRMNAQRFQNDLLQIGVWRRHGLILALPFEVTSWQSHRGVRYLFGRFCTFGANRYLSRPPVKGPVESAQFRKCQEESGFANRNTAITKIWMANSFRI